jgi:hypothetical protein
MRRVPASRRALHLRLSGPLDRPGEGLSGLSKIAVHTRRAHWVQSLYVSLAEATARRRHLAQPSQPSFERGEEAPEARFGKLTEPCRWPAFDTRSPPRRSPLPSLVRVNERCPTVRGMKAPDDELRRFQGDIRRRDRLRAQAPQARAAKMLMSCSDSRLSFRIASKPKSRSTF